ncbi:MAG: hypothetical protein O7I42_03815 [Alphaproteobacteria bacterium]|nr:hypothetical protein [Alphaproteobacteria bacterium]
MFWNKEKSDAATMSAEGERSGLEVTFKPGGGFDKNGCLIQSGSDDEYEKQSLITLELEVINLKYNISWGLEERLNDSDEIQTQDVAREFFTGTGSIQRSRWGNFALSMFGSERRFTSLEVVIRKAPAKSCYVIPFKEQNDMDLQWDEHFVAEICLDDVAFSEFRDTLMTYEDCRVLVTTKLDGMKGVFTTWSPSISEGRLLKFLDQKTDVTNHDELPEHFDCVTAAGGVSEFSVSISFDRNVIHTDNEA